MATIPTVDELPEILHALGPWQRAGGRVPLHPGDVAWFQRFGAEATAAALRTWRRDGAIAAVGLLDGARLLRVAVAPEVQEDEGFARRMLADIVRPDAGVLPPGDASVEARDADLLCDLLADAGWEHDEPWTPLSRDLSEPVGELRLRIETVGPELVAVRTAIQRSGFEGSTFTDERWHEMAAGPGYADARCLVGFDGHDAAVAAATVWSAGAGRPGLLEPVAVHPAHRGHGYGTAISLAAASALREMGASSAIVCTETAREAAVATYVSAGFERHPDVSDLSRRG